MAGISSKATPTLDNKYKFQGQEFSSKEFTDDTGLDIYEFKWRTHDSQIGRFWQSDPLADKYRHNSNYVFSENKVIAHREFEGLEAWTVNNADGTSETFSGPYANHQAVQSAYNLWKSKHGVRLDIASDGMIYSPRINFNRIEKLERGTLGSSIKGIVLHRTASPTSASTISSFQNGRNGLNYGTHFVVDKDGTIIQTASLKHFTLHVGRVRNKEFPINENSVGIEVVGMYDDESKTWEQPTPEQISSTAWLVNSLRQTYNLQRADVYNHDKISYKTAGEGTVVYNAISQFLFINLTVPSNNSNSEDNNSRRQRQWQTPRYF